MIRKNYWFYKNDLNFTSVDRNTEGTEGSLGRQVKVKKSGDGSLKELVLDVLLEENTYRVRTR